MKYLKPIKPSQQQENVFAKEILELFRSTLFEPILYILKEDKVKTPTLKNSINILIDAIKRQQIQYVGNRFIGSFNSQISKELRALGITLTTLLE